MLIQFGDNLLGLQGIKLMAEESGVETVVLRGRVLQIAFSEDRPPSRRAVEGMVGEIRFPMSFSSRRAFSVRIELPGDDAEERISLARKALKHFVACASFQER